MKRVLLVLLLFIVSKGFSQDLFEAASDQYDVLIDNFQLITSDPTEYANFNTFRYWDCPSDPSVDVYTVNNGWGGAQTVLSAILNYDNTGHQKYYELFNPYHSNSWTHWLINTSQWRTRWGTSNLDASGGDLVDSEKIVDWVDDSGWLINIYKLIYDYTGDRDFLDSAYKMLIDVDSKYGVNYGTHHFIRHEQGINFAKSYMLANIIGAIQLYLEYKDNEPTLANNCINIALDYYNFMHEYMISDGTNILETLQFPGTATSPTRLLPAGRVADEFRWDPTTMTDIIYCYWGFTGRGNEVTNQQFTFAQMAMAVVYQLFDHLQKNLNVVINNNVDFRALAIDAADYVMDSCTETSKTPTVSGLIFRNGVDENVNGFGFYWWNKYIVPLNSNKYGDVVQNTAKAIIRNYGTNSIIRTCWNGPDRADGIGDDRCHCESSMSKFAPTPSEFEFTWHASGVSIISAASAIEPMKKSYKEVLIPSTAGIRAFYMSATEITNAEYAKVIKENPYDYMFGILPTTGITYFDAILYCNARSISEGLDTVYTYYDVISGNVSPKMNVEFCIDLVNLKANNNKNGYRLPTKEEWQFAYLAGRLPSDNSGFYWPSDSSALLYANYNSFNGSVTPIGSFRANKFGLFDMAGNVAEWVTNTDGNCAIMNGHYNSNFQSISYYAMNNTTNDPTKRDEFTGFRVVRKAPDITPAINLLLD